MSGQEVHSKRAIARRIRAVFALFSVREDQADHAEIDSNIRDMVEFKGTKLWVLMFAIVVASIGLNVNSAAVIIGAMLISPLMGPIMGIGYGIGINDFELIKKSLKNIGFAALVSILSAALYFLISPLSEARSELLARTTPTIWDVLIALFGGLAGILATTRKVKSDVIPGVAIATALMPPLCTAGYGLATGHMSYFFGAFYLFFINMVFITLATVLFIGYLKPPHKQFVDDTLERRVRRYIVALVLVTVLPSIYMAYNMVTDITFNTRAHDFIKNEITKEQLAAIEKRLKYYALKDVKLVVHQPSRRTLDIASLKTSMLKDLYSTRLKSSGENEKQIQSLETELAQSKAAQPDGQSIARELRTQYPMLLRAALAKAPLWQADGSTAANSLIAYLEVNKPISAADQQKIVAWLKVRTKTEDVRLLIRSSHGVR
jgi:uncharacterized hydrophobic protein (TIGR00271 family)